MLVGARRSLKPLKVTGSRQLKAIMVEVHVHTCSTPISARIGISASCAEFLLPLWIPACETSSPLCHQTAWPTVIAVALPSLPFGTATVSL